MSYLENRDKEVREDNETKRISLISITVAIILLSIGIIYYKTLFFGNLMSFGKYCMEKKHYNKALMAFSKAEKLRPQDIEPMYYEVMTLGKLPADYDIQKRLYEIAEYDDCDEASILAENILSNIRSKIDIQAGENYIDNVLYEDNIISWDN